MHVAIVGGGVAGLALALALRRQGIGYTVLEQAESFEAVGAGIQLSPNATRALRHLGVADRLEPNAVRPGRHRFVSHDDGRPLLTTPLGDAVEAAFGAPYWHAHRADLLAAVLEEIGDDPSIRLGAQVTGVGEDGASAWADLASGERVAGDVLIAADGVRSRIRETLFTPETPRFSGCKAWRGLLAPKPPPKPPPPKPPPPKPPLLRLPRPPPTLLAIVLAASQTQWVPVIGAHSVKTAPTAVKINTAMAAAKATVIDDTS